MIRLSQIAAQFALIGVDKIGGLVIRLASGLDGDQPRVVALFIFCFLQRDIAAESKYFPIQVVLPGSLFTHYGHFAAGQNLEDRKSREDAVFDCVAGELSGRGALRDKREIAGEAGERPEEHKAEECAVLFHPISVRIVPESCENGIAVEGRLMKWGERWK